MMKNKQINSRGVITVMISLMLTGILSLGTMVIEAGRLQAARLQLDNANVSAGTSMIASFNTELYERYGLLAIDNDMFEVSRYREYLDFNSDRNASYKGNNISTLYVVRNAELEGIYNLTYPAVLKRQLLSRAKNHVIPQDYALNYYNMDYFLADYQNKATFVSEALRPVATGSAQQGSLSDVPADMQTALNRLYSVFSKTKRFDETYNVSIEASDVALLPSRTGTVESAVSAEDMEMISVAVRDAGSVLGADGSVLTSNSGSTYSEIDITFDPAFATDALADFADISKLPAKSEGIVSDCRAMVQAINAALNMLSADKEGTLLLNSYIAGYFPNKNYTVEGYTGGEKGYPVSGMESAAFAGACVEYIFEADSSETTNQQAACSYILATRLVSNLYSAIVESDSFDRNNACSVAAHIAWAYYETCADLELLFKYNAEVPLNKSGMILPINNIATVNGAFSSGDFLAAMRDLGVLSDNTFTVTGYDKTNYRDALALALWLVPNSDKMLRVADLIQLEMRYREDHVENSPASFLMSEQNTYCRAKCTGALNSVLPVVSLGSTGEVKGTAIQSIKYVGY